MSRVRNVERLVRLALAAYLVNALIAVGLAVYELQQDLNTLAALTVGRTILSACAVIMLLFAVRQLRMIAEIHQDHNRYLRGLVLKLMERGEEQDREPTLV